MLTLLVNADDFGLSREINEGIRRAHTEGILTSASLVASGSAFDEAVQISRALPGLGVGVHLTLVEERPVLDPGEVPSLVDSDGRFHARVAEFTRRYYRGQIRRSEVRRELDAQIRKIREAGIAISHADSHQHVHMLPGVFRETVALARDHSIPRIRIPAEPVHPYMFRDVRNVSRVLELLALRFFCALARRSPVSTADSFAGFYYGGRMNKRHLREILEHLPATGTCELMCHPGLDAPQSVYSYWRYRWNDELEALVAPEIAALLRQRGVTLASFPAAGKNTIEQWN